MEVSLLILLWYLLLTILQLRHFLLIRCYSHFFADQQLRHYSQFFHSHTLRHNSWQISLQKLSWEYSESSIQDERKKWCTLNLESQRDDNLKTWTIQIVKESQNARGKWSWRRGASNPLHTRVPQKKKICWVLQCPLDYNCQMVNKCTTKSFKFIDP